MAEDATGPPIIAISRTSTESRASIEESASRPIRELSPPPFVNTNPVPPDFRWYRGKQHASSKPRRHTPDVEWRIKWDKNCFPNGRVLIIDYVSNEGTTRAEAPGKRHIAVAAQEFENLKGLKWFYSDPQRRLGAALRVIHVQNATWATKFLLQKFNIDHPSEMVGMESFSKWAQYEKPRQRNGKPFPNGRTFRSQTDPWRNVSRTAFGLDYLKCYQTPPARKRRQSNVFGERPIDAQMMHLNSYEDGRNPSGYDVSVQRVSVYVQRSLGPPTRLSPDQDVKNPYAKYMRNGRNPSSSQSQSTSKECPLDLDSLDNTNTVIVFETSASIMMEHCLIQPRNDFENRWRRLPFYLKKGEAFNDSRLAAQCTDFILTDVFHGLAVVWEEFLNLATDHVNILEDKIYENPADESRAPELWTNQAAWLKVDKIMWIHQDLIKEMQGHMRVLANVEEDEDAASHAPAVSEWLSSVPAEYDKLSHSVQEDLVQPTTNLSDLMYKSVGIRDSRQSLQLGLSMWRLSWITFIFLPLTFVVSFFGMNVDTFQFYPSIGWYFVAAAVLMLGVLFLWYCVKHSLQRRRQTPYQRGLYENLFDELEDQYPRLWSSAGAAEDIHPLGIVDRMKWQLLKRWFAPERTINKQLYTSIGEKDDADLGSWARTKKYLLRKWLPQILESQAPNDAIALAEIGSISRSSSDTTRYGGDTIQTLAKLSTPVVMAEAEPTAVQQISTYGLRPASPQGRKYSAGSEETGRRSESRPNSRGSSGLMFEERVVSDSESEAGEGSLSNH